MAVTNISPIATYTGNNVTTQFSFSFKINDKTDVKLFIDNVAQTYITNYTVDKTTSILTTLVAPTNGSTVRLQRDTTKERGVDYVEGGGLSANTLDGDIDKLVLMIQEHDTKSLSQDVGSNNYNVGGNWIINVNDPINAQDGATKAYADASTLLITTHTADMLNPHGVTAAQLNLGSVDNTTDVGKPISDATQSALNLKVNNNQVLTNVPIGAVFTDTLYTKASIDVMGINAALLNNLPATSFALTTHNHSGTYANSTHSHTGAYEPVIAKFTAFNKNFGNGPNDVCSGDDSRLSDMRTALAHSHVESDLTIDKYTQAEVDAQLALKQNILDKQVDQVSDVLVYKAYAITGSLTTDSTWTIAKYSKSGDVWTTTYPSADDSYSHVWDNRLSYTYS